MGLTNLLAQPVFTLRAKLWKVVIKCKNNMFLYFWASYLFSGNVYFSGCDFFLITQCFSSQFRFSVVVRIYKIHVFGEAFFLLAILPIITGKEWQRLLGKQMAAYQKSCSLSI